jgi:hypothetical protein
MTVREMTAPPEADESISVLARLFAEHAVWREAGASIREGAASAVWFRQCPGRAWRLVRQAGVSRLEPGRAEDPDFVFRFGPESIAALEAAGQDSGDFAVCLFDWMIHPDPDLRVDFRIAGSIPRLVRNGYVGLLRRAGPKPAAFAAAHGVSNLRALRRLIRALRRREPFAWEVDARRG